MVYIPARGDRFHEQRIVFGSRTVDVKVSTLDTNGGLYIFEITDALKGGPARHFHHEQEEWFYVIESEYILEIGDESGTSWDLAIPSSHRERCRMSGLTFERGWED